MVADHLVGATMAIVGAIRLAGRLQASRIAGLSAVLACWLLLSAVLLADSTTARLNEAACGFLVLVAGSLGTAVSAGLRRRLRS